ncbi:hypothetical protein KIW84_061518 [Lathyrus oleraceus]|uniref:Fe2OG dioxygenase domain-containing protein n=1 Tax=Pisum sativum TaxID=3888 RepID=A0A9D4W420_PEA|nr:hypothetical protein KIW84_061518 [Pisum sativum]
MEKLTPNWSSIESVPENYIFPPETRPGDIEIPISHSVPVIDLSEAHSVDRTNTIQKIIKAAEEFGFFQHYDAYLITILLQDDISGLQVLKDGEWIGVEALPHAFLINIGYALKIISNGKLQSVEHRAVTNSTHARTSVAFFIAPSGDCFIEPAQDLIDEHNPPIYTSYKFKEFLSRLFDKHGDAEKVLKSFEESDGIL